MAVMCARVATRLARLLRRLFARITRICSSVRVKRAAHRGIARQRVAKIKISATPANKITACRDARRNACCARQRRQRADLSTRAARAAASFAVMIVSSATRICDIARSLARHAQHRNAHATLHTRRCVDASIKPLNARSRGSSRRHVRRINATSRHRRARARVTLNVALINVT